MPNLNVDNARIQERIHSLDMPADATNDASKVAWLESLFEWGLRARDPYEQRALRCMQYWAGDQWASVEHDLISRHRRAPIRPPYCDTARVVDNQIPIYIRQVISMCTDAMSDYEATPSTPDKLDRQAAALATRLIKMRERDDREDSLREDELLWLFGTGELLRRTWYDPHHLVADGTIGDLRTEVVPLFRYVTCPTSAGTWPPRWVIEFDARHIDWIQERYGKKLEPEGVADRMAMLDALAANVITERSVDREKEKTSVILKRLYAAPCTRYPEGRVFVWARGELLAEHGFQIPGVFPFSRATWYQIPGRLYAMPYLEPLLSDQRSLNILLSQLQEIKNRQLRGDMVVQGQGEITQEVVDERTGQKILHVPEGIDAKFEFIDYSLHTALAEMDYQRLRNNLHDKAGLAEPTLGQVTNRKTTATELQLLREAGFQSVAYHMRLFDRHQCEVNAHKILLAREYFTAARIIQDVGDNSAQEVEFFFGSELRTTRDVTPIASPRLTPAMRREAIVQAAAEGLLAPWVDQDGVPSPLLQFHARSRLRNLGLLDLEEQYAQRFGSYEELAELVADITKLGHEFWLRKRAAAMQIEMMQVEQALMQAQMPQQMLGPDVAPEAGQPPVSSNPLSVSGAATYTQEGYMPPADGSTPTDQVLL